jgi:hypothetical protein
MRKNKTDDGCMLPLQSSGATVWYGNDGPTDHDPSGTSVTSLLVSVRLSPAAAALEKKMLYCCVTGLSWVIGSYLGHVRIHGLKFRLSYHVLHGCITSSVRIAIIKQITELLRNLRDEFIKPN